jgi:prepilin signal peptidase PulO-like enzyme (type II secretory pathway)
MSMLLAAVASLATSLLFGGMLLFSFGFAAFLFSALPSDTARATIRKAFPHFYLFVIFTALVAAALTWPRDAFSAGLLAVIALTTLPARQILMPAINRATDSGAKARFKALHAASVVLTLSHIGLAGAVLTMSI